MCHRVPYDCIDVCRNGCINVCLLLVFFGELQPGVSLIGWLVGWMVDLVSFSKPVFSFQRGDLGVQHNTTSLCVCPAVQTW